MSLDTYKKTTLKEGIRIVTESLPYLKSVAIGIWVDHGSRDEKKEEAGLAHFLEHILFKSTNSRDCKQISYDVEKNGGDLNAFTSKDHCCYHAICLKDAFSETLDVLTDVVFRPTFDEKELEQERKVILQEIAMTEDDPEDFIEDLWFAKTFQNQSMGQSILGTKSHVEGFSRQNLIDYHSNHYKNEDLIISVVGDVSHEEVLEAFQKSLSLGDNRKQNSDSHKKIRESLSFNPSFSFVEKDLEQVQFTSGFSCGGFESEDRYVASLLNMSLGGGMSSRFYQVIREKLGLAYAVSTDYLAFSDLGVFDFSFATSPQNLNQAIDVAQKEIEKLKAEGISESELKDAKKMIRGAILISEDDPDDRMTSLALSELRFGKYIGVEEVLTKLDSISRDQVSEFIQRTFHLNASSVTMLGKKDSEITNTWRT